MFTTGQRCDGIYIISCFVVDHYYARLGRCCLFMLLSLNYFPFVSPSLCLGRAHLVGVDRLWHEERRNQTPISRYQTSTIEVSSSVFASIGTSERNDASRSFGALIRFNEQSWTATSTNFRVLIQHCSAFIANWHSFDDVNVSPRVLFNQ